ncbi:hypothetical protein EG68_09474 [Paragonimus skrjabini miyazakii]|uniref:Inhibitor of growth protein n=1 Tax=Paragonimus skrjabini miyazakii TaxID=59628 RepID=A0A8S9YJW7_9TREM|nr:hypothetical protein EG68_09474 [Paragonimus skrjabini miyazakii]
MLYFEDFMEAIENLPEELNESLTTVRQLDILTQSLLNPLHDVEKAFFEDCKYNKLSELERTMQYTEILKEYEKALGHCRKKREIVEKIYNTYEKLVRKLDTELEKFRLELEADNSGITEQIEKRINTVLGKSPSNIVKPDKRRQRFRYQPIGHFKNPFLMRRRIVGQACRTVLKSSAVRPLYPQKSEAVGQLDKRAGTRKHPGDPVNLNLDGLAEYKKNPEDGFLRRMRSTDFLHDPEHFTGDDILDSNSVVKSNLNADEDQEVGFSNAMSILSTKSSPFFSLGANPELNPSTLDRSGTFASSGRTQRLGSFGSYGAASDISDNAFSTNRTTPTSLVEPRTGGVPSPVGWHGLSATRDRRSRCIRRPGRDTLMDELVTDSVQSVDQLGFEENASSAAGSTTDGMFEGTTPFGFVSDVKLDNAGGTVLEDDEDQRRYCVCNDVSYGDMIACDNPSCPFEWFHYSCVNLTVAPKGDWFCPNCVKSFIGTKGIKKRIGRK